MAKEYLDKNGLAHLWDRIKNLFLGKSETAVKTESIPFANLDSTSTSTVMTAQVDGITELRDGVCVFLRNGVATSASGVTLNINGLGAKPIYSTLYAKGSSSGKVSTRFNIGYTILFVYSENWVDGGAWLYYDGYDSNTNTDYTLKHYYVGYTAYMILYRYQILLSRSKTELLPINTVSNGYNKTDKVLTTEEFDPFGKIFYYGSTTTVQAGAKIGNNILYEIYYPDLRYSFNVGSTLTANKPVFIVCVPQSNGMARLYASPISQELPTSDDGLLYVYLGQAWSTYQVELLGNDYPVYKYVNGRARRVTEDSLTVNGHTVNSDVPANAKFTDTTYGNASTSAYGITKLSIATNSTAKDLAATPSAVKTAYDLADTANTKANEAKSGIEGTLLYDHTYSISGGIATFTAHVYCKGQEVTEDYADSCFSWAYRLDNDIGGTPSLVSLGTGKTKAVILASLGYGGHVIGTFTPA